MEKPKVKKKSKKSERVFIVENPVKLSRFKRFITVLDKYSLPIIICFWSFVMGAFLQKSFGAVRMKDDPKQEEYRYIMKTKDVMNGCVKWVVYDADMQPYEIGDLVNVENRNNDNELISLGSRYVVLEIRKVDENGKVIDIRK